MSSKALVPIGRKHIERNNLYADKQINSHESMDGAQDNKIKILLLDDDEFLISLYQKQGEVSGVELQTATSGEAAIAALEGGLVPHVIALDMSMVGMTGLDVVKTIKEKKLAPEAKLVMLSNTTDDATVAEAKALGVEHFIVKASILPSEVITELTKLSKDS